MGHLTDAAHAGERWTNNTRLRALEGWILFSVLLDDNFQKAGFLSDDDTLLKLSALVLEMVTISCF